MIRSDLGFQLIVAANKVDVMREEEMLRHKANQENNNLVRKYWRCPYIECSARHNYNIALLFRNIAQLVINHSQGVKSHHEQEDTNCCPFSAINIFN